METSRRGFLGAAFALAAMATIPGTATALAEDDAARLARLLSTPGSVISGQEFHIRRSVPIAELRDITIERCKIYLYGDADFLPAKCSRVNINFCTIQRVDGEEPLYLSRPVELRGVKFRVGNRSQLNQAYVEAMPGDVIDMSRGFSTSPVKLFG